MRKLTSLISQGMDGIALCGFEGLNANGEQGCCKDEQSAEQKEAHTRIDEPPIDVPAAFFICSFTRDRLILSI